MKHFKGGGDASYKSVGTSALLASLGLSACLSACPYVTI
jgi:hypothetical protein